MKRILAAALSCVVLVAFGQTMTLQEARKKLPLLADLPDDSFVDSVHRLYYPHMDKAELSARLGYTPAPPKMPKILGPLDRWRYESCQTDASKAPTPQGVNQGMRVCREKFDQ